MIDQKIAADLIRQHLERRLAQLLDCEPSALPRIKIGTLVHTIFLLAGDQQSLPGFSTAMSGLSQLLDFETIWDVKVKETSEELKPEKETVN